MKQNTMQGFMGKYSNKIPKEGEMTKRIEDVTAKVPSVGYLVLALGSLALSAGLTAFTKKKFLANFIGLCGPSFMLIGIYNKLVKLEGHDSIDRPSIH